LIERVVRNDEVVGLIPICSTNLGDRGSRLAKGGPENPGQTACRRWISGRFPRVAGESEDARFPKTVIAPAGRIGRGVADYDVIQQLDVHGTGRVPQLAGHLDVRRAGAGSPLGWLWTQMTDVADCRIASR
jgi:hypothetical protein